MPICRPTVSSVRRLKWSFKIYVPQNIKLTEYARIIIAAKEVTFSSGFVCLSVSWIM